MIVNKLWYFFRGNITISVRGSSLERFVNLALSRGIILWDIKRRGNYSLVAKTSIHNFKNIKKAARLSKCKVKILRKSGFPFFMKDLKSHKYMAFGAILFCLVIYILSSFIWVIEITGNNNLDKDVITNELTNIGIKPGVLRRDLDRDIIRNNLLISISDLAWVGVDIDGTKLKLEIVEKVQPPDFVETTKANLVADKDGLVSRIIVIRGEAAVKEGDTVSKGDVLIHGYLMGGTQWDRKIIDYTRAEGIVEVRRWADFKSKIPLDYDNIRYTGNFKEILWIRVFDNYYTLSSTIKPFSMFREEVEFKRVIQWRNIELPVELIKVIYYEVEGERATLSREEGEYRATKEVMEKMKISIPEDTQVLNQQLKIYFDENSNMVIATLTIEILESIGVSIPLHPPQN